MRRIVTATVLGVWSVGALATSAAVVELQPMKDNTLYESPTGRLSNGSGAFLFAGRSNQSNDSVRRALLAFDLSSVPSDSTVNGATLALRMSRTVSGDQPVRVHRVTQDWGEGASNAAANEGSGVAAQEGDATWIHSFFNTQRWNTSGGDFVSQPSAETPVGIQVRFYNWQSPSMANDVQTWVANPSTNFGWILLGNEATKRTAKRFDSREAADPQRRPKLTVDFTVGIDSLSAAVRTGDTNAIFDLDGNGNVESEDRRVWVEEIKNTYFGDSNLDGEFSTTDFVLVFQEGQYEDGVAGNSVWATGDWNGDAEFDSSDFIIAFQAGGFEKGPRAVAAVPEPAGWLLGCLLCGWLVRRMKAEG